MGNNAANVAAGKPKITGAVFKAPVGTSLPTDVTTELNEAFKCLGYVSEDGVSNTNAPESESVKAWGGDTVLNLQKAKPDMFKFKLIETLNVEALKAVYNDDNVSGDIESGITVKANNAEPESFSWIIEIVMKESYKRIVIPSASLSALDEIVYNDSNAIGYGVTISAVPDTEGNTHYEYIKKISTGE